MFLRFLSPVNLGTKRTEEEDKWYQSDMGGIFSGVLFGEKLYVKEKKKKDVGAVLVFEGREEEIPMLEMMTMFHILNP